MATLKIDGGKLRRIDAAQDAPRIDLAQWRDGARPEAGPFVLRLSNDADPAEIGDGLRRFAAIELEFPTFRDGRAYTQARVIRERFGFRGELRATGEVLCDQALFMLRAGFDALDIGDGDASGFERAISAYSVFYQNGADGSAAAHASRRSAARAAA